MIKLAILLPLLIVGCGSSTPDAKEVKGNPPNGYVYQVNDTSLPGWERKEMVIAAHICGSSEFTLNAEKVGRYKAEITVLCTGLD